MGKEDNLSLEEQLKQGMLAPGNPLPIRQTIEMSFQDDTLSKLQESSKQFKLTESAGGTGQRKLMVTVEGIHTGMTKNKTFYPGNALEESVPTWVTPHNKPVLKNHNEYSEPLGRIVHSEYVESTLIDKYTVRLKLEVTDQDAIEKVLDGRYLTLSVGGSANRVVCSACSKDIVKEGYCGHARGRMYDGKEAYWTIAQYTGDEISFVNMPADVHAQVIAAELVTSEGGKNVGKSKENADPATGVKTTEADAGSLIDDLLDDPVKTAEGKTTDPVDPVDPVKTTEDDNADNDKKDTPPTTVTESDAEKIARLEEELTTATGTITTLEAASEAKDTEIMVLTADLKESSDSLVATQANLDSAEVEKAVFIKQNTTLARFARKSLAERVADLRIMQGKSKIDERDELINEWSASSSKVLESQINDLLESGHRYVEKINSPGFGIAEKNAPIVDEEDNIVSTVKSKESTEKKPLPTMKAFGDSINKSMFRTT